MTDPFFTFWKLMREKNEQAPPLTSVGQVVTSDPFRMRVMGLVYGPEEIKINAQLLPDSIEDGDEVLCLTMDGWQTVIILCKVVAA